MLKSEIDYSFFSSFIARIPVHPISFYKNLTNGFIIEEEDIKELLKDNKIKESLFVASPELYKQVQKWISSKNYPADKGQKIKISLLKYFIRMSTRCTPFGLFSACGSGKFGTETKINIDNAKSFYRKTRFDMQFIANLGNELQNNLLIQNDLLYYPNSTLYKLGDYYRYVQYILNQDSRNYSLEAVKRNEYLDFILEKSVLGISKIELINFLKSDEITEGEAIDFIDELISNQILVSELELTLTGDDFLNKLLYLTDSLENSIGEKEEQLPNDITTKSKLLPNLKILSKKLAQIDEAQTHSISSYEKIIQIIKDKNLLFNEKYLFQTDLFLNSNELQLDGKYKGELLNAIKLLNKISSIPQKTFLENFKTEFIKRYDGESIPLVKALDFEAGIGYGLDNGNFDVSPILDGLGLNELNIDHKTILGPVEKIIHYKFEKAIINNEKSTELTFNDFKDIDFSNQNLPDTFSCLFEIVKEDEKEWIVIQNIGGSSAANLFARFCYGNDFINAFASEITKHESDSNANAIIAEIVHLPESRTGNVLRRPTFRSYEIPYLGQSNLDLLKQIHITDIHLKLNSGRLILWSKKHGKEIIPKLTNAHNFSYKALPIYQFLCDMQFENCKSGIGIKTDNLENLFNYFPRVTIGNCIILKAKWIFSHEKNPVFFMNLSSKYKIYEKNIFSLIADISSAISKSLPQYISLVDGDNTLIINTQNSTCVEMLLSVIKNRTKFILEEYLFPSDKIVKGKDDYYANEFIASLKWEKHGF